MPFVKLDCGLLNSTIWFERDARDVFLTALLLAEPRELAEATAEIATRSTEATGWMVPPGWYGFVPAAGVALIDRARVEREPGLVALELLARRDPDSRTPDHDGRRLVRVDGGFIVLNFFKYRDRDYTAAERSRRYRARAASRRDIVSSRRDITQAEAEAEVEAPPPAPPPTPTGDADTAPPRKRGGTAKPNDLDRVLAAYVAAYERTYARQPVVTPGDRSQVGRLLREPPAAVRPADWTAILERAVADYVGDGEDYLVRAAHPLRAFPGAVNRYLDPADMTVAS